MNFEYCICNLHGCSQENCSDNYRLALDREFSKGRGVVIEEN